MDDPVKEIESVVRSFTQGSPNEQAAAVNRYFVPAAEFVHPFCRVPPFQDVSVPLLGDVNSRQLVLAILRWYRIISPRIDMKVNSVQFDPARNTLYVDLTQRFALWFVPFYAANVNLVSVVQLVQAGAQSQADAYRQLAGSGSSSDKPDYGHGLSKEIHNGELPSFAAVASARKPLLSDERASSASEGQYLIAKQEDLYQVNDWIKFIVPFGIGEAFVWLGQLLASALCLAGSLTLFPLVWILTHGGDSGNVMPPVKRVADDGHVVWKGTGAEWAERTFSPLNSIGRSAIQGFMVNVQDNAGALVERGEVLASHAQQRARKVVHNMQAHEETMVRTAQQKAQGLADGVQQRAQGLADGVQQGAENLAQNAQQKTEQVAGAAQQKERELVRGAQAKEEQVVGHAQSREEQAAENTKQWWAANKK